MRRAAAAGAIAGLAAIALLDALAGRAGAGALWPRLDGPGAWLASRAAGATAFLALALDTLFGLAAAAGRGPGKARAVELHRFLSTSALLLVALHALALLLDGHVRFDLLDLAVPFLAPWRRAAVGLGVLALLAGAAAWAGFALRRRLGARGWRRVHRASYAAFALASVHALAAGTDAGEPWLRWLVGGAAAAVAALTARRVAAARAAASAPSGGAGARRGARP